MADEEIRYKNLTYMIVDDMTNMRKTIKNMLMALGVRNVLLAENGSAALKMINEYSVDFVICDWNMPGLSGIEFLEIVRNMPEFRSVPFLMVTAEMGEEMIARAVETEVDGYVIKPFVAKTLEEKIIDILTRRLHPTEEQLAIDHALMLKDEGKYEKGLDYLKAILGNRPNSARLMHMIGFFNEAIGEAVKSESEKERFLGSAEEWYQKASASNPLYIKVHQALGEFYEKKGDQEKALDSFEAASRISPYNTKRIMRIGEIGLELGKPEKADRAFKTLINMDSAKKADVLKDMGELYLKHGYDDKAAKVFSQSLAEKENPHVYNRLGIALRRQGKPAEAADQYKKAILLAPDDEVLQFNLGKAFLEMGELNSAKKAFRKAVSLDPGFEEAREELDNL